MSEESEGRGLRLRLGYGPALLGVSSLLLALHCSPFFYSLLLDKLFSLFASDIVPNFGPVVYGRGSDALSSLVHDYITVIW